MIFSTVLQGKWGAMDGITGILVTPKLIANDKRAVMLLQDDKIYVYHEALRERYGDKTTFTYLDSSFNNNKRAWCTIDTQLKNHYL